MSHFSFSRPPFTTRAKGASCLLQSFPAAASRSQRSLVLPSDVVFAETERSMLTHLIQRLQVHKYGTQNIKTLDVIFQLRLNKTSETGNKQDFKVAFSHWFYRKSQQQTHMCQRGNRGFQRAKFVRSLNMKKWILWTTIVPAIQSKQFWMRFVRNRIITSLHDFGQLSET